MSDVDVVEVEDCNSSEMIGPSKVGGQGVKVATFHQWKYSHYFVVVDESEKNMRARCTLCSPSSKPLSCARNTTSNFKKTFRYCPQNCETCGSYS